MSGPHELMFGRKAVLPVDIDVDERDVEDLLQDEKEESVSAAVDVIIKKRVDLLGIAKSNIVKAQQKQKLAYDKKRACPSAFEVNQLVLLEGRRQKKHAGGKLDERYTGPYIIVKKFGKGIFSLCLQSDPSQVVERVSGVHLKAYKSPVCYLYNYYVVA